jgi:amino acid adenylation domain-containing protein
MATTIYGIFKAGGAYVPLEPSYPAERLRYLLTDSGVQLVLTQHALLAHLPTETGHWLPLDATPMLDDFPTTDPPCRTTPDHLAYVLYTSGSTGQPKAAMNTHRALANRIQWMDDAYRLGPDDAVLQKTPFSFDVSVWEFLWPLWVGARLVMAEPGGHRDPAYLKTAMDRYGITTVHFVPAMLTAFLADPTPIPTGLRRVLCSGEALSAETVRAFMAQSTATLDNLYGPTEAAIDVSFWSCPRELVGSRVPIGRPIANLQLHVLDAQLTPVPVDTPGELYLGGIGVGRGYLRRPGLTAEKFLPDSFSAEPGARMYRTGDRACWGADGTVHYLGRTDFQVKLRGQRLELGEIEAVLQALPGVQAAVVIARTDRPGEPRLVAYVVGADDLTVDALRAQLRERLPEYMVPAAVVRLAALPVTPNGKLDRKALPAPTAEHTGITEHFVAPRNETEQLLAGIWGELLGLEQVGIHDNFFEIGGHSLLATRLTTRVNVACGCDLPVRVVFDCPTVAELAKHIRTADAATALPPIMPVGKAESIPLSFAQERLWFLDRLIPNSPLYNIPIVLRLRGELNEAVLRQCLRRLFARHESLRTHFTEKDGVPYQVVDPVADSFALPLCDLSHLPPNEWNDAQQQLCAAEATTPFSLSEGPLWRARLARFGAHDHLLLITLHHIIADGWSLTVFMDELRACYCALISNTEPNLCPLPIRYADYACWQRGRSYKEQLAVHLEYWQKRLAGLTPLELPTDRPRPAVQGYRGASIPLTIPADLYSRLVNVCRAHDVTPFMGLLAIFQALLSRWSGQEDITVGTPVANRTRVETEQLIGLFVNTLVIRSDLSGLPSLRSLLAQVREHCLDAYAHQDIPFEMLVSALQPDRNLSASPLFQVMFVLQNTSTAAPDLPGLQCEVLPAESRTAKLDLTLDLRETDGGLTGVIEYATDLFDEQSITRLREHFFRLLDGAISAPDTPLASLPLLSDNELAQLEAWNATAVAYPATCVHTCFEAQVRRTPDAIAVEGGETRISYADLNRRANQLAHYLRTQGIGPESLVGIAMGCYWLLARRKKLTTVTDDVETSMPIL